MTITASKAVALSCLLAGVSAATAARAADDFVPRAVLGASWSDNVDRARVNKRSDLYYAADVGFTYFRETERLSADVDANYLYYGYARDTFPSENLWGLDAVADWRIVPEVFSWMAEDQYGQVSARPFGALTPGTRENVNYFTTGPTLRLMLGDTNELNLRGFYSSASFDVSDIDNDRFVGAGQLLHRMSELSNVSLNYEHTKVEFAADRRYPDYQTDRSFVRLETATRRSSLAADAGLMSIDSSSGRTSQALLGLTTYRLVGAFSMLGIDFRQGYSDAAEAFRFDQRGTRAGLGDQDVLVQASPFRERRVGSYFDIAKPRSSARLEVFYSEEHYTAVTNADREVRGAELELGYRISSRGMLTGYMRYEKLHQPALRERDTDKFFGLEAREQLTRSTSLQLLLERYDRNSNITQGFVENRITVYLRYQPAVTLPATRFDPYRARGLRQPVRAVEGVEFDSRLQR